MSSTGGGGIHWLLVNCRIVLVYLLHGAWSFIMKKLKVCCCFWRPKEDQYKLVSGDQELITIRPKVYSSGGLKMNSFQMLIFVSFSLELQFQ